MCTVATAWYSLALESCGRPVAARLHGSSATVVSAGKFIYSIYIYIYLYIYIDRLCGLVVRVSGYRYRGLGFDSRRYQIF